MTLWQQWPQLRQAVFTQHLRTRVSNGYSLTVIFTFNVIVYAVCLNELTNKLLK